MFVECMFWHSICSNTIQELHYNSNTRTYTHTHTCHWKFLLIVSRVLSKLATLSAILLLFRLKWIISSVACDYIVLVHFFFFLLQFVYTPPQSVFLQFLIQPMLPAATGEMYQEFTDATIAAFCCPWGLCGAAKQPLRTPKRDGNRSRMFLLGGVSSFFLCVGEADTAPDLLQGTLVKCITSKMAGMCVCVC